jgi:CheY-like chemotaxis protein
MAHDLNNLFVPILLAVDHLADAEEGESPDEMLQLIESSAKRGVDMVKQVLSLARGGEDSQVRIRVGDVLDDIALIVRATFPSDIVLRSQVDEGLWEIIGDSTHIHQIFMNLFVNARDAMPGGGTISAVVENVRVDQHYAGMIGSAVPGPYVRISIIDTGAGIPRSVLDRVFEPFFSTKGDGLGTGLGLSTVAAIVRRYGGFVSAYSEIGVGTTFRFHFPAAVHDAAFDTAAPDLELLQGRGECILVVDDEAAVRSITEQTLLTYGYRVLTATDGADAIAVFGRRAPEIDLVLTDTVMPIMDGPTAIRALLRIEPSAKVIIASGAGSKSGIGRAREYGAAHFLPKPYTAHTLLATIQRVLQSTAS